METDPRAFAIFMIPLKLVGGGEETKAKKMANRRLTLFFFVFFFSQKIRYSITLDSNEACGKTNQEGKKGGQRSQEQRKEDQRFG